LVGCPTPNRPGEPTRTGRYGVMSYPFISRNFSRMSLVQNIEKLPNAPPWLLLISRESMNIWTLPFSRIRSTRWSSANR
jgi:hypothetical protein